MEALEDAGLLSKDKLLAGDIPVAALDPTEGGDFAPDEDGDLSPEELKCRQGPMAT